MFKVPSFLSFFPSHNKQVLSGPAFKHQDVKMLLSAARMLATQTSATYRRETHTNWVWWQRSWEVPPPPVKAHRYSPSLLCFIDPGNGDNGCYSHQQEDPTGEGNVFASAGQQQRPCSVFFSGWSSKTIFQPQCFLIKTEHTVHKTLDVWHMV